MIWEGVAVRLNNYQLVIAAACAALFAGPVRAQADLSLWIFNGKTGYPQLKEAQTSWHWIPGPVGPHSHIDMGGTVERFRDGAEMMKAVVESML